MNPPSDPGAAAAGIFGLFFLLWAGIIVVGIALTVFWIIELIDVARREFRDQNTKLIWLLVVIFSHTIGALVYYFAGKPQGWLPGEAPKYPQAAYYPPQPPENRQD